MEKLIQFVKEHECCIDGVEFIRKYETIQDAWDNAPLSYIVWLCTETPFLNEMDEKRLKEFMLDDIRYVPNENTKDTLARWLRARPSIYRFDAIAEFLRDTMKGNLSQFKE